MMHSTSKFISGHSDLMAGVLAVRGERSLTVVNVSLYSLVNDPCLTPGCKLNLVESLRFKASYLE
ncbi:hypothetical protein KY285_024014 [Solanum tuberosum]|nr:hypothetical protein KY289_024370 [Solanum tuberosum]KAH0676213.1 hypothetical protein KY285_024014 [Solanum tuberosum]